MADSGADRPALPTGVGRYEIRSRLASDPIDEVYDAFDPLIERPVAIKLFSLRPLAGEAAARVREAFAREMPRAGILTHPGIVSLYDAGEWPGGLFMASEFVEGVGLAEALQRDVDLDLPLRVSLLVQIVDALEHARDLGVAHLNLKPSNIHVGADYMLKVGSFGLAPVADALVAGLGLRPSPSRHTAPERLRGSAGDVRSDSYAVAQLALDILAGPDRAMPPGGWATPPPLPPALAAHGVRADRWETLFTHALADEPEDRFPSAGAFSAELLMRLELSETEARLAWETSRAMGALAVPDPSHVTPGTPSSSTTTTTTTTADVEFTRGESETVLGPVDRRAKSDQPTGKDS